MQPKSRMKRFGFRPREQVVGHSCTREDRQQGRPKSRTPASGAVWSNWGGSPSDEEPSGRSLRTLSRGDQAAAKFREDAAAEYRVAEFISRVPNHCRRRLNPVYCLSETRLGGDRIRPADSTVIATRNVEAVKNPEMGRRRLHERVA